MKKTVFLTIFVCVLAIFAVYTLQTIADQHPSETKQNLNFENNWHHWRGPHVTGAAVNANPPTTWSETENIRWKVRIPGMGHATPIIWEDKIYIQTAIKGEKPEVKEDAEEKSADFNPFSGFLPQERGRGRGNDRNAVPYKFNIMALNRSNGDVLWEK